MFNSNLPTDNLYKFLALAGVALIMFTFYLSQSRLDLLWQREEEFQQSKLLMDLATKTNQLKQQSDKNTAALRDQIKDIRMALIDDDFKRWRFREATIDLLNNLQIVLYIGCLLTGVGFTFWYTRVQKYLDMALKQQSLTR